jgi:hypothetical protein
MWNALKLAEAQKRIVNLVGNPRVGNRFEGLEGDLNA